MRMSASIPILEKTPFALDPEPLTEMSSPHAGLLATSRVFRSLRIPALIAGNISTKQRQRGFLEGQLIESLVLLQTVGGECIEDMKTIAGDECLERGLGYEFPKVNTLRDFLNRFHDEDLALLRPPREEQKSFILQPSKPLAGLQNVLAGSVRAISAVMDQQGRPQMIATVDQDATIIESHKAAAYPHYDGGRGYQPMVAVWAEANLVLAAEFRDGNVPARHEPVTCAEMAFDALPQTVTERYFRGDSGCHERGLLGWLNSSERDKEAGGRIGFCVSACVGKTLAAELAKIGDTVWKTFGHDPDGTLRQWADVDYLPSELYESKAEKEKPLRYVGLRLLKPQGSLFADGSDRMHFAVITNLTWTGDRLLPWHREKAGTIEHVHDEIKNGFGGAHLPSQHVAVNAAWFTIALLSYNIASAIKDLCFDVADRTARVKRYRLQIVHLAGRMSRFQCKLRLRLRASDEAIKRMVRIWEVFDLPTQATAFK
jgi:Transposase DDE domain group 1